MNYNRIALVNFLVNLKGSNCNYLEIGCDGNELFNSVSAINNVGIDPERGGTVKKTSDDFFFENTEHFDVVFIDGLHEYTQVKRDTTNALKYLNNGGWIAFHDSLPRNWLGQHIPRLQKGWTGDVWKLAVELSNSKDLDFRIHQIDHGVGILRARVAEPNIVDMNAELEDAQFDYFYENFDKLPVCCWSEGVEWIKASEKLHP